MTPSGGRGQCGGSEVRIVRLILQGFFSNCGEKPPCRIKSLQQNSQLRSRPFAEIAGARRMGKHETGYTRVERDLYPTPHWVVAALAEHVDLTGLSVWEPVAATAAWSRR